MFVLGTLDARAGWLLFCAWARRAWGDEELRRRIQADPGGTDTGAQALIRWLSGMSRLRAADLLFKHFAA